MPNPPENREIGFWIKVTSLFKIVFMLVVINYLRYGQNNIALSVFSGIIILALLERISNKLSSRVCSALTNRVTLIPVLICLTIEEIQISAKFPILMFLGMIFITFKEMFFIRHGYNFLFKGEEYIELRKMQKINASSLAIVVILYILQLEPYNNIAMLGVIVISVINICAFLWKKLKQKRGIKDVNLATKITLMRLLMSPAFLIVYFYDRNPDFSDNSLTLQILAILFSIFFVVTDGLDGYFARKRNEVTKLGKYLDPFSDKICTMTIFLCFVASNYAPVWMIALIYYREASISVIRTLAAAENVVIAARPSGKWKTGLQGTAIITLLVLATIISELSRSVFPSIYPALYADFLLIWNYVPFAMIGLVTLVTISSGVDYVIASRDILDKYFR